jgi:hypothetical protein
VTSGSWDGEKVILKDEVLEVRNVDGRLYVARKAKKPDEWDRPIPAYDPYGPGTSVAGDETKPYSEALDGILAEEDKLKAQLARKRRNAKIGRARRKRGVYRLMISVPGSQFRRLAELGYLKRVDNPAAQITALGACGVGDRLVQHRSGSKWAA